MSEQPWTVRRVLGWTSQHFEKLGLDSPRLTAELLLAHVLHTTRVRLYTDLDRPLEVGELGVYRALIARRATGEPTHYLTGTREFYGRPFAVDARVLVPRPETELLVEAVLQAIPRDADVRLLDLCTGAGCVGITLALERPRARVVATEISPEAAEVALANATTLGVGDRFEVRVGDLFTPVQSERPFSAIAANPPYVPRGEIPTLAPEVRHEPALALDGGPDGLDLIRRIVAEAPRCLVPGALLAMEIGDRQGVAVRSLLEAAGYGSVRIERDLARHDRLALGTHPRGQAATHPGEGALGPDPH